MMPFIIVDLYIVNNNSSFCLQENVPGISFNLKTWLEIDAVVRIGLLCLFAGLAFLSCCCTGLLKCWVVLFIGLGCIFGFFYLAWLIVGSIMFWGTLNPEETCDREVSDFMWSTLIINLVLVGVGCFQGKQSQQSI